MASISHMFKVYFLCTQLSGEGKELKGLVVIFSLVFLQIMFRSDDKTLRMILKLTFPWIVFFFIGWWTSSDCWSENSLNDFEGGKEWSRGLSLKLIPLELAAVYTGGGLANVYTQRAALIIISIRVHLNLLVHQLVNLIVHNHHHSLYRVQPGKLFREQLCSV